MNTLLKNLTIKNNFMFATVMSDEENCKDKCRNQSPISRGAEKWRRDLCFWNY
ncbi:MAG: hypothetical protein ACLUJN_01655 [Blautia sp.]